MEKRENIKLPCEFRATGNGKLIEGVIPYNSTADIGGYLEMLQRGCFAESIADGHTVFALHSHDQSKPLANSTAGTLTLEDKPDGLHVTIKPDPASTWGKDTLIAAKRGDLGGLSFGFTLLPGGETWEGNLRTITNAELHEISPVVWPCYEQSTISVRNKDMNNNTAIKYDERGNQLMTEREWLDNQTINSPFGDGYPGPDFLKVHVEDQPIYRGFGALARQCVDIAKVQLDRSGAPESRERIVQVEKRERELRAAGVGMVESVAVDGGMVLQGESTIDLMTNGWNNNAILTRTDNMAISGAIYDEVGIDESSRANGSRGGGVRVYTDKELGEITSSKTTLKKTRWEPEKLTGLIYMSNELDSDVAALQGELNKLFGQEFAFKMQDLVVEGSGVGEALGFKDASCTISIAKESGQTAKTIDYNNLLNMLERVHMANVNNLTWLVNQDCLNQLFLLTIPVGTGGTVVNAFRPDLRSNGSIGTLLTYPVIPIEQAETLGTKGDITLCDLNGYKTVNKGGIESAVSAHVKFINDQLALRFIMRFGGQPKLKSPITPFKGTNTVSPFVALADRS